VDNSPSIWVQSLRQRRSQQVSVPLTPNIYAWYHTMQQSHTVYFDKARASWLIFRYDDVQQVILDTRTFSSLRSPNLDGTADPITGGGILGMDPPHHRQLRALISQAFTPRAIALLEPRVTAIVQMLLEPFHGKSEMDLIDDLAFPLPLLVMSELLGVPTTDRDFFRQCSAEVVGAELTIRIAALKKLASYFQVLIQQRRREPREDLISELLRAEVEGEQIPELDVIGTCILLLVAGHETTTGLIGNAVVCFDEHADAMQELRAQPELLPAAIEEVLRYRSVVHSMSRVALADTALHDQEIKAGDWVLPLFASANLDETHFPDAMTFDIRRTPNRHMGFGYGIHFCLGASLARLEVRIALQALLERFSALQRIRTLPLEVKPKPDIYGLKHVPISLKA
jgi:cytochrome P450